MRVKKQAFRPVLATLFVLMLSAFSVTSSSLDTDPVDRSSAPRDAFAYPNLPAGHESMRRLLDNAFAYANPAHGLIDPASGYPVEGWNQEPRKGLFLRSFTQLTAIGAWIELLANIVAGQADNPYLSREAALKGLTLAVGSLLEDQANPELAAKGLLVNFLGLEPGGRKGPLQENVERRRFVESLGEREGNAIWRTLVQQGWLQEEDGGRSGRIRRGETYGANHFEGALAAYADEPLKSRIMALLDRRAITIIFGDNANLTAALARSVGALLRPELRSDPDLAVQRERIERFIEGQKAGYAHLFDPGTGTFVFGWDATADRFVGWGDGRGNWVTGQMNYFINEFRGPWTFVVLRHGLPIDAIRNAGFKIKPYRLADGSERHALAAWEGSAFQLLGLSLFMREVDNPAWRESLETLLDIELDYSSRHALPGFLSEAYSGNGTQYTGLIGIPEIAVTDGTLITHAPSLYTLGAAYALAPERVDAFVREHWDRISALFTPHGPWEGWNTETNSVIPYQTTAHTLSLLLGGINTAQDNMRRYLAEKGLDDQLAALYAPGDPVNFLDPAHRIDTWTSNRESIAFSREEGQCRFAASLAGSGGMVFGVTQGRPVSLSNGRLRIRYRAASAPGEVSIGFKRAKDDPLPPPSIPIEILPRLERTEDGRLEILLPATPALQGIEEVSLTFLGRGGPTPVDVSITAFEFTPFDTALEAPR